jgi:alginate O-acetyltransferase complex protein AlgI
LVVTVILAPSASIFQSYQNESVLVIWFYLFMYTWFFYLNFAAFSDMAIGFARLFGFKLKENFSFPFQQKNIADFWNSWHMSLSRFAQRNVYVPMGGYRQQTQYFAILATIMVIALWHDLTLGMLLFGLYHGVGLLAHRFYSSRRSDSGHATGTVSAVGRMVATYVFVTGSFPLLVLPLEQAMQFYRALFGLL